MKIYIVFDCKPYYGKIVDKIFLSKTQAEEYVKSFFYCRQKDFSICEYEIEK